MRKKIATAAVCLALAGCGGSGGSIEANKQYELCSADDMKSVVLSHMQDYYLFYDQLPNVNASDYVGPEDYIEALRVSPYDRYSYVTEESTREALFEEGKRFGFGMRVKRTEDDRLYFTLVEPLSPLGLANAERGDELLAINGVTPNGFTAEFITAAFGEPDEAIDMRLTLRKKNSTQQEDVVVTKALYDVRTVLDTQVITHNNDRVGYLNFLTFLETSEAELNTAFDSLKSENVDELVLDLRHNLGGRISVAEQLGSLIAGTAVENTTFTRFTFNDKYASANTSYPFQARDNALGLSRVYVLTSPETCSASEMVINSLKPFIDVITVGGRTCGKPYGTRSREYCGKSINALEVNLVNAVNAGGYYDGIPADCPVSEDLSQALGSRSENLFNAALSHVTTSQCATGVLANATTPSVVAAAIFDDDSSGTSGNNPTAPVKHQEGPHLMDFRFDEIRPLLVR